MVRNIEPAAAESAAVMQWIDGRHADGASARYGPVFDPATGRQTKTVAFASAEDVDSAVAAAAAAFPAWRDTSLARRQQVLFAFRELLNARKDDLAAILTAEHGKVLSDALGEVSRGQEVVEFACGIPHLLKGGFTENASTRVDVYSLRQPLGVVAIILPFNFPAMVPMWFFPIAIACGNTVILKPSEKDPSAASWLAELWAEAGLPQQACSTWSTATSRRSWSLAARTDRLVRGAGPRQSSVDGQLHRGPWPRGTHHYRARHP